MSVLRITVKEWIKNEDTRKKKYCSCGAVLRANKCWRCDNGK